MTIGTVIPFPLERVGQGVSSHMSAEAAYAAFCEAQRACDADLTPSTWAARQRALARFYAVFLPSESGGAA